ncbi:MAG: glycosyltransferase family 2 protein [Myxococcales bacterium]|nr:glycosyltransferase family 2 protein [Myxococcales bacterium]
MRSLSIVLPARNEASNIARAVGAALDEIDRRSILGEVIVVDDGSVDSTRERAALSGDRRVRVCSQAARGYGAALLRGVRESRCEHLFLTDADLQFDLRELSRLEEHCADYEIVVGYRAARADPVYRRVNGWVWNVVVNATLQLQVRDVDCAFKLFRREVFEALGDTGWSDGAFASSEILARALQAGFRIQQVPVTHLPRPAGRASGADPRVIGRAWVDFGRFLSRSPHQVAVTPAPLISRLTALWPQERSTIGRVRRDSTTLATINVAKPPMPSTAAPPVLA